MEDHILSNILKHCDWRYHGTAAMVCSRWFKWFESLDGSWIYTLALTAAARYGEIECLKSLFPKVNYVALFTAASKAATFGQLEALKVICAKLNDQLSGSYYCGQWLSNIGILKWSSEVTHETIIGFHAHTFGYVGCCAASVGNMECALYIYEELRPPSNSHLDAEFLRASIIGGNTELTKYFLNRSPAISDTWKFIRDNGYGSFDIPVPMSDRISCFQLLASHFVRLEGKNAVKFMLMPNSFDGTMLYATPDFKERCFETLKYVIDANLKQ